MYILDKKCSVAPLKNWGRAVSSTEMKLEISSVTPTSKYSLTKLRFASCNAHSLPGILWKTWQHNIIRPCEKYKIFFEKENFIPAKCTLSTKKWNLKPHIVRMTIWFLLFHTFVECLQKKSKNLKWNQIKNLGKICFRYLQLCSHVSF